MKTIPVLALSVSLLIACDQNETAPSEGFAVCETKPTTRIALAGILNAKAEDWGLPNLSVSLPLIDGAGLPLTAQIEFTISGSLSWKYQVWGRGLLIGSGALDFSNEGLLATHKVVQPLRVPELSGEQGPAISLFLGSPLDEGGNGLDGFASYAASSSISRLTLNGMEPAVANACAAAAQEPEVQSRDPETGACPGHPTTAIQLIGNLDATASGNHRPWDLDQAFETCTFSFSALAYGPGGVPVAIDFYFVKGAENEWVYHVVLGWDTAARLLTTGTLSFSDTGALVHRKDFSALRIPDGKGVLGPPVELNLGLPQDLGADGLSGLTGRASPSNITSWQIDGTPAVVGGFCR